MAKQGSKKQRASRHNEEVESGKIVPLKSYKGKPGSARMRADEAWTRSTAKPLKTMNDAQAAYLAAIRANQLTFGIGPAGTGKTYVCVKHAAMEMDAGNYAGIVVVRPIVEAGGGIGFLPGTAEEKTAPYQVPFLEVLEEHFGKSHLANMINGPYPKVTFIAPEFIRGRTFERKFVILDEAQNMTPLQMKTFLTRIGENSKVVVNGDIDQVDIRGESGLADAQKKLEGMENVAVATFTEEDIVRSGLVRDILKRYRSYNTFAAKS